MTPATIDIANKLDKEINTLIKRSGYTSNQKKHITYSEFLENKLLMIRVIKGGVPYSLFNLIRHFTPFTEDSWADVLNVSTKSLQRYRQTSKSFKPIQSEKIIEVAEVTKVGLEVFGDMEKFKLWIETPIYALGNLKPIELLKDSYGKELVINELTRINYGILV